MLRSGRKPLDVVGVLAGGFAEESFAKVHMCVCVLHGVPLVTLFESALRHGLAQCVHLESSMAIHVRKALSCNLHQMHAVRSQAGRRDTSKMPNGVHENIEQVWVVRACVYPQPTQPTSACGLVDAPASEHTLVPPAWCRSLCRSFALSTCTVSHHAHMGVANRP
jgi:hypothetical protein